MSKYFARKIDVVSDRVVHLINKMSGADRDAELVAETYELCQDIRVFVW